MRALLILAVLLAAPVTVQASPAPVTHEAVRRAAQAEAVPVEALLALWERECSLRPVCGVGDGGRSYGPFQVQAVAADRHGCEAGWQAGAGNARCAARILADWDAGRGDWARAFTRYNWPEWRGKGPSPYGMETFHFMLRWLMRAQQTGTPRLAQS